MSEELNQPVLITVTFRSDVPPAFIGILEEYIEEINIEEEGNPLKYISIKSYSQQADLGKASGLNRATKIPLNTCFTMVQWGKKKIKSRDE